MFYTFLFHFFFPTRCRWCQAYSAAPDQSTRTAEYVYLQLNSSCVSFPEQLRNRVPIWKPLYWRWWSWWPWSFLVAWAVLRAKGWRSTSTPLLRQADAWTQSTTSPASISNMVSLHSHCRLLERSFMKEVFSTSCTTLARIWDSSNRNIFTSLLSLDSPHSVLKWWANWEMVLCERSCCWCCCDMFIICSYL